MEKVYYIKDNVSFLQDNEKRKYENSLFFIVKDKKNDKEYRIEIPTLEMKNNFEKALSRFVNIVTSSVNRSLKHFHEAKDFAELILTTNIKKSLSYDKRVAIWKEIIFDAAKSVMENNRQILPNLQLFFDYIINPEFHDSETADRIAREFREALLKSFDRKASHLVQKVVSVNWEHPKAKFRHILESRTLFHFARRVNKEYFDFELFFELLDVSELFDLFRSMRLSSFLLENNKIFYELKDENNTEYVFEADHNILFDNKDLPVFPEHLLKELSDIPEWEKYINPWIDFITYNNFALKIFMTIYHRKRMTSSEFYRNLNGIYGAFAKKADSSNLMKLNISHFILMHKSMAKVLEKYFDILSDILFMNIVNYNYHLNLEIFNKCYDDNAPMTLSRIYKLLLIMADYYNNEKPFNIMKYIKLAAYSLDSPLAKRLA